MNMGSSSPLDAKLVEKKLQNLSNTRESIQTLSMWAISHKAQHEQIVSIWFQVLKTAKIELRLCLFYLCNDIVQTCRREHAVVFKDAFKEVLKDAALLVRDASVRSSVKRIFKIWLERKVYDEAFVKELLATLYNTKVKSSLSSKLLAGFHPENLKKSIIEMTELEEHVEVQRAELSDPIWTAEEVDAHKQEMKNRGEGEELVRKMERIRSEYEKYVASLEKEGSQRKELILTLELSELFYDAQLGECNILTTAYKTYTMKLNQVKKRLWEFLHPEEKEKDQLKKVRKRKKSKSIDLDEATTPPLPITSTVEVSHHNGPILIQSVKGAETLPPALSPPPPPSELWGVPSVAPVMKEVHRFHHFQADHQPNQLHNESNFYQQHQELQQQQQQLQQQQQYHPPVTLLQSQIQQLSHSFSATTAPITPKVSNAVADDCYEMNHYEIGGEEGTPVYDEDIMESGDATPVQDEDPADGYIPSKERKASRPGLDNSKDHSSQPGVFMGVRNPGPLGMPIGCLPTTPDITRPPPPLNIFFSPPGMIKSTTPGSMGDKEKSSVDAPQGQSLHPQIMQMPPGMFSIVGMPIPSSIASPTLPQFGMIPFAGAALPSQQQQLAQGQPNFNLLPAMGQTQLMPQLAISGPFSQQIMSPPPMVNPLQTIQQQQQQSQQPQQVSQRQFQKFSNIRPLMLMSDNQKRPEFRGNPSPSLSSSSIPTLERSTSANEAHYQSLIPTTTTNHNNNNNNNNNDYSTLPRGRARDHFKDGESADKRSRPRINQNNLTHVKTMEHSNVAGYTVPETNL